MAIKLFGFTITSDQERQIPPTPVTPSFLDGSTVIDAGGVIGYTFDIDGVMSGDETNNIVTYREISNQPEVENAIDDIVNEAIVYKEDQSSVKLNMNSLDMPQNIKDLFEQEFNEILRLYEFNNKGSEIFKQWYVDGRKYYNVVVDPENPKLGILELREMDALSTKKVTEIVREKDPETGSDYIVGEKEYFVYDPNAKNKKKSGQASTTTYNNYYNGSSPATLSKDSVIYADSGVYDYNNNITLSYLHKAIRPANNLRMMENAIIIHRLVRAPERRVFNIPTAGLNKNKAEEYVRNLMNTFRNKVQFNAKDGTLIDDKRHFSMLEDYWFPQDSEGRGVTVNSIGGSQTLGQLDDLMYFQSKLYQSLNVPFSRMPGQQSGFSIGRSTEVTRDEVKFNKFINRLRKRFNTLFFDALRLQLIFKGVILPSEWDQIKEKIFIDYVEDNYFSELKEVEIFRERITTLNQTRDLVGEYFSRRYVQEKILKMTDSEIEEMEMEMEQDFEKNIQLQQRQQELGAVPPSEPTAE